MTTKGQRIGPRRPLRIREPSCRSERPLRARDVDPAGNTCTRAHTIFAPRDVTLPRAHAPGRKKHPIL